MLTNSFKILFFASIIIAVLVSNFDNLPACDGYQYCVAGGDLKREDGQTGGGGGWCRYHKAAMPERQGEREDVVAVAAAVG